MHKWNTTKVELDPNKEEIRRFLFRDFTVSSAGYKIDETEYDEKSNIVCKRTFRYFENGEIKEFIEYNPQEELLERQIQYQNDFGNIDRIEHEFQGGFKIIKKFFESQTGVAYKCVNMDEEGAVTSTEIYVLNDIEQMIEAKYLDEEDREYSKYEYEYDSNGQLKTERYFSEGIFQHSAKFEYNGRGLLVRKELNNEPYEYQLLDTYEYDKNDNLIKLQSLQNEAIVFDNRCVYNENNELILEEFYELNYWERRIIRHEKQIHELIKL